MTPQIPQSHTPRPASLVHPPLRAVAVDAPLAGRAANGAPSPRNDIAAMFVRHQNIMRSFRQEFATLPDRQEMSPCGVYANLRRDLIGASCLQQKIHSVLAHDIFYPALRQIPRTQALPIDSMLELYALADDLLNDTEACCGGESRGFDAYQRMIVALEQLFAREADQVLPQTSLLPLPDLEERLIARRAELLEAWDGEWCGRWGESLLWKHRPRVTA